MSEKIISSGDSACAQLANGFVRQIENDPARYRVSAEAVEAISAG